jgi:sterol 14-demethylase
LWRPPREEDKRDFAYISFGGGRHKCLGNAFAILQIKAILALLLGQYEFELAGDPIESDFHGLVVGPKEPCRVRYRRRAQPSVTMSMAEEIAKAASPEAMAAAAGCPAHANGNGAAAHAHAHDQKKLRVVLDRDLCQGHAMCVGEAPEVFRIGSDGKVETISDTPAKEHWAAVRMAAKYCPTRTIRVIEE